MEIGLNLPVVNPSTTPGFLGALARRAEELGFAELYLGEHVVLFDDPADDYPGSEDGDAFFPAMAPLPDPIQTLTFLVAPARPHEKIYRVKPVIHLGDCRDGLSRLRRTRCAELFSV